MYACGLMKLLNHLCPSCHIEEVLNCNRYYFHGIVVQSPVMYLRLLSITSLGLNPTQKELVLYKSIKESCAEIDTERERCGRLHQSRVDDRRSCPLLLEA